MMKMKLPKLGGKNAKLGDLEAGGGKKAKSVTKTLLQYIAKARGNGISGPELQRLAGVSAKDSFHFLNKIVDFGIVFKVPLSRRTARTVTQSKNTQSFLYFLSRFWSPERVYLGGDSSGASLAALGGSKSSAKSPSSSSKASLAEGGGGSKKGAGDEEMFDGGQLEETTTEVSRNIDNILMERILMLLQNANRFMDEIHSSSYMCSSCK